MVGPFNAFVQLILSFLKIFAVFLALRIDLSYHELCSDRNVCFLGVADSDLVSVLLNIEYVLFILDNDDSEN